MSYRWWEIDPWKPVPVRSFKPDHYYTGFGGGSGGEYASEPRYFNPVEVTGVVEPPMTRDQMYEARTQIWMAMRNLLLVVEHRQDNYMTAAQHEAWDILERDIELIDFSLTHSEPLRLSSLTAKAPQPEPEDLTPLQMLNDAHNKLKQMDREYEAYKEHYARTGNEESFEKMLDCVYIDE